MIEKVLKSKWESGILTIKYSSKDERKWRNNLSASTDLRHALFERAGDLINKPIKSKINVTIWSPWNFLKSSWWVKCVLERVRSWRGLPCWSSFLERETQPFVLECQQNSLCHKSCSNASTKARSIESDGRSKGGIKGVKHHVFSAATI